MKQVAPQVGDVVLFTDGNGKKSNALVTAVHADRPGCMVNLGYVMPEASDNDDQYGRYICPEGSVVHVSEKVDGGTYWMFHEEFDEIEFDNASKQVAAAAEAEAAANAAAPAGDGNAAPAPAGA